MVSRSEKTWKPPESVRIGPLQPDERVHAAEFLDQLLARAKVQVVGVAEDDVGPERAHLVGMQRLDRALRADRHERGRADVAVRRREHPRASGAVRSLDPEAHRTTIASPNE